MSAGCVRSWTDEPRRSVIATRSTRRRTWADSVVLPLQRPDVHRITYMYRIVIQAITFSFRHSSSYCRYFIVYCIQRLRFVARYNKLMIDWLIDWLIDSLIGYTALFQTWLKMSTVNKCSLSSSSNVHTFRHYLKTNYCQQIFQST